MFVCMYRSIYNAPLLQPKQSRVCIRRPNRKDVSLAYYRIMSVCKCWITKWRWQRVPQLWSISSKAAWS